MHQHMSVNFHTQISYILARHDMGDTKPPDATSLLGTIEASAVSTPPSSTRSLPTFFAISTSPGVVKPLTVLNVDDFFLMKASSECKCMYYLFGFISLPCAVCAKMECYTLTTCK